MAPPLAAPRINSWAGIEIVLRTKETQSGLRTLSPLVAVATFPNYGVNGQGDSAHAISPTLWTIYADGGGDRAGEHFLKVQCLTGTLYN